MKTKYPKNYIRELRDARKLSLEEVAERVGVTNPYISMLELGKRGLSWAMVRKLADALECHPLEITEGPGDRPELRSKAEKDLLRKFRGLADGERQMFTHMLDTFADKPKKTSRKTKKK